MANKNAFGEAEETVARRRTGRGSNVRVTVKIIHDDGKVPLEVLLRDPHAKPLRQEGYYVVVSVLSQARAGLEMNGELLFNAGNAADIGKRVNLLGGALAEGLCEKYGDRMDPGECAKAASEAWLETLAAVERL